jgi:hypothetical protein
MHAPLVEKGRIVMLPLVNQMRLQANVGSYAFTPQAMPRRGSNRMTMTTTMAVTMMATQEAVRSLAMSLEEI